MEEFLSNRLILKQQKLRDDVSKARELLTAYYGEDEIVLKQFMESKIILKQTITALEKEIFYCLDKFNEKLTKIISECTNEQMIAEDVHAAMEAIVCCPEVASAVQHGQHKPAKPGVKLPKLELLKFSGDLLEWSQFWDCFEANIHTKNLKDVEKMAYLMTTLEGHAKQYVEGLCITNENYTIAVNTLKERFGLKEKVIDAHYKSLFNIKKCSKEANSCRDTLNMVEKHLRVLKTLGEDVNSSHLRVVLSEKFPENVMYQVHVLTPGDQTIEKIRQNLDQVITAMERSGSGNILPKDTVPDPPLSCSTTAALHIQVADKRGTKRKMKQKQEGITHKKPKFQCIFCSKQHYSSECEKITTLKDRRAKLKGRCFVCFKIGHNASACRTKKTCFFCKGSHNSALCPKPTRNTKSPLVPHVEESGKEPDFKKTDTQVLYNNIGKIFLQTAVVTLQSNNKEVPCRLIMDSGSQRSYMTKRMANKLSVTPDRDDYLMMFTFGSDDAKTIHRPSVEVNIHTKRGLQREIRVNLVPHITNKIPIVCFDTNDAVDMVADDESLGEDVELLIGNDYYFSFIRNERIHIKDDLILINTDFGWIVSGNMESKDENTLSVVTYYCQCHNSSCAYFTEPDLPLRNIDMKFLWNLESIGITDSPKTSREEEAVKYFNETVTYNNGRYEVKWPWIQYPSDLPTNYSLAYGRLKSLLRRSDESTLNEYNRILEEQLNANIIEEVVPQTIPIYQVSPPIHYLPHHMVKQEGKSGRIVYDASAKIKDRSSLNECMYRGPSLLEDLTALLLKFRIGKVGITADVEKAFLQVGLQENDRDVTILWIKDTAKELTEDNIRHLRFCRVPFGIISSPFLLKAAIRYHISRTDESLLRKIADKCYVDNLVTSVESVEKAVQLYDETKTIFDELSMNIRDWVSNDTNFMEKIPVHKKGKQENKIKILGLNWNLKEDTLQLKIDDKALNIQSEDNHTKKNVLKALARVYDPCGFVSPLILPAKLLFQELCIKKYKWDDPLDAETVSKWEKILEKLKAAKHIEIPRYVARDMPEGPTKYELHVFTDASKLAYSAVAYLRIICGQRASTAFLMSKSRVTPIEDKDELKIPRLELLGYLIGSRLLKYLMNCLDLSIDKQYLWTDSQVVLYWLKTNNLLPPFVKRRIDEIKQLKNVEFCYINTNDNPADLGTRPELWDGKKKLWLAGPPFLTKNSKFWPSTRYLDQKTLLSAGEVLDIVDGPEMVIKGYEPNPPDYLIEEDIEMDIEGVPEITEGLDAATSSTEILKRLQKEHFPNEVKGKTSHLTRNLDLFLDVDGILRCGGRMKNANWSYDKKHPIIIPKASEFTNKIIQETHEKNYHVGPPHTLNIIREKYWIPQGRAQVAKVIKRCVQCVKQGGGPYKLPQTPALPSERVNYSSAFTFTGIDYFGPMYVSTTSGGKEKRWICLFTCLAVRAIHLEIVKDLSAEECVLAIRRFVANRAVPSMIISDNALQFKLTSEVLITQYCTKNNIIWKFIPQLAPWHGGFYERLVGLVKHCLKRTLEKHLLNDSQLSTVIKEVEAVVNTRPLTSVGADLGFALRPADFLTLGKCLEMTPTERLQCIEGTATKVDLIQSWRRGQKILSEFKKMFQNQYLPSLRENHCHSIKQSRVISDRTPKLGDCGVEIQTHLDF